jgi:hypothetical protein
MHKTIVITTVFPPTASVRQWAEMAGWNLIVVGDRKTPDDWHCPPAEYLSPADQETMRFRITRLLPWNHYARKLLGYLAAIDRGAEIILDTDDDNLPKPGWRIPEFVGTYSQTGPDRGFVNIYTGFTPQHIWPRGFPLNRVCDPSAHLFSAGLSSASVKVGIWQGLADGDPDVDAVYRMTVNVPCYFDDRPPIVLNEGTVSPFNSQNTAFERSVFPLLYLPAFVPFRSTDIIRGLVAQPILWRAGYALGFTGATVVQNRNDHHYLSDFESEIPCYLHAEKILDIVAGAVSSNLSIENNLVNAYNALVCHHLIPEREMDLLTAWIADIQDAAGQGA